MDINKNDRQQDYDLNPDFPVKIQRHEYQELGHIFASHWHEHFQILYCEQGEALVYCNSQPIQVRSGEIVVINGNDVHYGENLSGKLVYYIMKVEFSFLFSNQLDLCQTKYINPLVQNRIFFQNQIPQDEKLLALVRHLIGEYNRQEVGYELEIKAYIYHILVLLLRHYGKQTIDETEQEKQRKIISRLRPVLEYMDQHYNEKLSLKQLATMVNMSRHHFCRLFRNIIGKPPVEYINQLRINKALSLLQESSLNVSEIAMTVGFNDSNYFSRMFKKYKQVSPSKMQK